jgi:hypothetical protein
MLTSGPEPGSEVKSAKKEHLFDDIKPAAFALLVPLRTEGVHELFPHITDFLSSICLDGNRRTASPASA